LHDETTVDFAAYRMEKSKEDLKTARINLQEDMLKGASNRAYYSVFHAMRAVLALEGIDYKKHSAVHSHFTREYLATNIIDRRHAEANIPPPTKSCVVRRVFWPRPRRSQLEILPIFLRCLRRGLSQNPSPPLHKI